MSELKPCPFCGEPADDRYCKLARCSNPSCLMNQWLIDDDTAYHIGAEWNTRPIEDDLRKRIAELEAERRWIPVTERLPRDGEYVLAAFTDTILTATYHRQWTGFVGLDDWLDIEGRHSGTPTHWMPLPKLPEEVGNRIDNEIEIAEKTLLEDYGYLLKHKETK